MTNAQQTQKRKLQNPFPLFKVWMQVNVLSPEDKLIMALKCVQELGSGRSGYDKSKLAQADKILTELFGR